MSCGKKTKTFFKSSNTVANSIKNLKLLHIKRERASTFHKLLQALLGEKWVRDPLLPTHLCSFLPQLVQPLASVKHPHQIDAAAAKSRPTLCDPIDGSPLGSPVPGILQTITLEWVAIAFSFSIR